MKSGPLRWSGWVSSYEVLIFDWDGTLVDSIGRIVESVGVASHACGLPALDEASVKGIIGLSLAEAFTALYPQVDELDLVERFRSAYAAHYLALEAEPSQLYPGVAETLHELRERGYRLAVATGKGRRGLDRVLAGQGWQDFFDITRCSDETAGKPDPRMILEILAHFAAPAAQALMIGDSVFDLEMARRAGVDSVAVTYGAQSAEVLRGYGPRLSIDRFAQLGDWLRSSSAAGVLAHV